MDQVCYAHTKFLVSSLVSLERKWGETDDLLTFLFRLLFFQDKSAAVFMDVCWARPLDHHLHDFEALPNTLKITFLDKHSQMHA